jgi:hypothetical protein
MRIVSARTNIEGAVSQYCYKLGLEDGGKNTVLGYTAMEGFKVISPTVLTIELAFPLTL